MTTNTRNFIDPALHVSTLPATYVPPGNLVALVAAIAAADTVAGDTAVPSSLTASNASTYLLLAAPMQEADLLAGRFTGAGHAVVIPVGFMPSKVEVVNWTDTKRYTWLYGAPATDSWYDVASADPTVDTGTGILVTADGSGGIGNVGYVTIASGVAVNNKTISFRIVK